MTEQARPMRASLPFGALPAPESDDPTAALEAFPCLLDLAEAMLLCGTDVHNVEVQLASLGRAYGAAKMNVFVITGVIIATMTLPNGYEHTLTRRIMSEGNNDFHRMERLIRLCREARETRMTPQDIRHRLAQISSTPVPAAALFVGGILSAGSFAMFFGGTLIDGIVSALFAVLICLSLRYARPWTPNTIIFNFVNSFCCGLGIMAVAALFGGISTDMVMIGDIMLLIPGVAMTNATRDMLIGDTISGVMRFVESLLWAVALALGFMCAIWLAQMIW